NRLYTELNRRGISVNVVPATPTIDTRNKVNAPGFTATPKHIEQSPKSAEPVVTSNPVFTLPMLEWINIPAGTVKLRGIGKEFEVAPFAIAKYPVTNAQFQAFIKSPDGYKNDEWWNFSTVATIWHQAHPRPKQSEFKDDKLPRETVCWYEAMAF